MSDGIKVLVGVRYTERDASAMLSRVSTFAVAPMLDDYVEILPARGEGKQQTHSAWHATVRTRWINLSEEYDVEVQVTARDGELDAEHIGWLREAGYA